LKEKDPKYDSVGAGREQVRGKRVDGGGRDKDWGGEQQGRFESTRVVGKTKTKHKSEADCKEGWEERGEVGKG
jgi:hypothetical protein